MRDTEPQQSVRYGAAAIHYFLGARHPRIASPKRYG